MRQSVNSPENLVELARACEAYVMQASGFQLDYTVETLPVLDQYAREVQETIETRPELLELLAHAAGAYFGQVLCGVGPGFWRLPSGNVLDWQVCMREAFLWLNPIGVAYDVLSQDSEHAGPNAQLRVAAEDRDLVKARLARLADVPEEEYYSFSTRMEVIEMVLEELKRQQDERGYGGMTFDESDYEAEQQATF